MTEELKHLYARKSKAEQLEFTELIKFLPQYISICKCIEELEAIDKEVDTTEISVAIVTGLVQFGMRTFYEKEKVNILDNAIWNAIKDKDYMTIVCITDLLDKYAKIKKE